MSTKDENVVLLSDVRRAIEGLEEKLRRSKDELAQIILGVYMMPMAPAKQARYDQLLQEQSTLRHELSVLFAKEKTLTPFRLTIKISRLLV